MAQKYGRILLKEEISIPYFYKWLHKKYGINCEIWCKQLNKIYGVYDLSKERLREVLRFVWISRVRCHKTENLWSASRQTTLHKQTYTHIFKKMFQLNVQYVNVLNVVSPIPCPHWVNLSRWCPHRWMQMEPSSEADRRAPHKIRDALYALCLTEPITPEIHATNKLKWRE